MPSRGPEIDEGSDGCARVSGEGARVSGEGAGASVRVVREPGRACGW